jgi:Reverse transcriptase (RNA-dependent DNA polymerase)
MQPPKGIDIKHSQCLRLNKALYGLVQASRQFYVKFSQVLTTIGFTVSYADPCLFFRNNHHGRVILVVNIDDCYAVGDPTAFNQLALTMQQTFADPDDIKFAPKEYFNTLSPQLVHRYPAPISKEIWNTSCSRYKNIVTPNNSH